MGDFREADGAFLMHLAAYLYGYRLQFHDWWLDGRIPMKRGTHHIIIPDSIAEQFFSVAYKQWRDWDEASRRALLHDTHMFARKE